MCVQGSSGSQVPQSKYSELLAIIEELGKEIRPTYAGSKSAMERIKRGNVETSVVIQYLYCVVTQTALSRLHNSPLPTNSNLVRELSFSQWMTVVHFGVSYFSPKVSSMPGDWCGSAWQRLREMPGPSYRSTTLSCRRTNTLTHHVKDHCMAHPLKRGMENKIRDG